MPLTSAGHLPFPKCVEAILLKASPGKAFAFSSRCPYGVVSLSYGDDGSCLGFCGLLAGHTYESCAMGLSDSSYFCEDSAALGVCSRALHDVSYTLVLRQQGKSEQAEQMHRQGLEIYAKCCATCRYSLIWPGRW